MTGKYRSPAGSGQPPVAIDGATLARLVSELTPLVGARLQKLRRQPGAALLLDFRHEGQTWRLRLDWSAEARLHLVEGPPPPAPTTPPSGLFRKLRKTLTGALLDGLGSAGTAAALRFARGTWRAHLWLDCAPPALTLLDEAGKVVVSSHPRRRKPGSLLPLPAAAAAAVGGFPTHRRVAAAFAAGSEVRERAARKATRKALKKARRLLANLERDAEKCRASVARTADAELLKTVLHRIERGQAEVLVEDLQVPEAPPRRIALDPALGPSANLQRLFLKARKGRRGLAHLAPRLEAAQAAVEALERRLASDDLLAPGPAQPAPVRKGPERSEPFARYRAKDGRELWVGRNAKANDAMLRRAKGNDQWLHVRDGTGSHVIVRRAKGDSSQEALLDAATLAVHFSKLRGSAQADVRLARVKDLRKVKGVPGKVIVQREQTLRLRFEPARLERLLRDR